MISGRCINILDKSNKGAFSKLRDKMDIDKETKNLIRSNEIELNIRAEIIKQRAKDEKAVMKNREKYEKKLINREKELTELGRLKKESVLNNKIDELCTYFTEELISEECYTSCIKEIYNVYYD